MQRLRKTDLVVKSPGLQIRERIQRDYGDLKAFAKTIDMSESSVDQYLTHKNLGSSTFKIRLTRELGQDFRSLYKTDQEQVEALIERFMTELISYERLCELQLSEVLHEMTKTYNAEPIYLSKVYFALALYREACGEGEKALAYLSRGLQCLSEMDQNKADPELKALLLARWIWIERKISTKDKLFKDLNAFSVRAGMIDNPELISELFLTAGQALAERGERSAARSYFNQAEDAAISDVSKGRARLYLAFTSGELQAYHDTLEMAERLLRGSDKQIPELLLARAKLSELEASGREALNYLQMALERCGRKLTAHNAELTAFWLKKLMDEIEDEAEYDKLLTTHIVRIGSELARGYRFARNHLKEVCSGLNERPLSARGSLELMKALGKIQHLKSYHPSIADAYYQLMGILAAEAFGSDVPALVIEEVFEEDVFEEEVFQEEIFEEEDVEIKK